MTAESDCRWLDVCPDYYGRLQVFKCAVPKDGAFVGYRTRFDLSLIHISEPTRPYSISFAGVGW
ncbi:hypothetical protein, partial [Bifidobacterium adolescentis]|uniref:hypothetical protein n=1 Tax=Bifidobacterium adolescentis TaxID=1680 RepID=UPI0034A22BA8